MVEVGYNRASLQQRKRINKSKERQKRQRLFGKAKIYTSGREHSLRRGFGFARPRVLAVPLTFLRFGLGPSTAATSASTDLDPEADAISAGVGGVGE